MQLAVGCRAGRSYRFYTGAPLWPFGYSGSYTTWAMAWAEHPPSTLTTAELESGVRLAVRLRNTGRVGSAKALLFFVAAELADAKGWAPPRRSLFAIAKAHVAAGGSTDVQVNSSNVRGACAFCTVDTDGAAAVRPGSYTVTVGDGDESAIAPLVLRAT